MLDVLYDPAWTSQFYWLLIVAFVFAFSVSFGMGANDSCNDWGPAVGAGTVKLWQAYILCGIFNTIGAILLGYKVTETLRSGIVEVEVFDVYSAFNHTTGKYEVVPYCDGAVATGGFAPPALLNGTAEVDCAKYTAAEFMVGQTGAMAGVAAFMIVSSVYKIPVSATHAIVGASLASSLYLRGNVGIKWSEIGGIVMSWFISPLIAGFFASAFYLIIKYSVLLRKDTFKWALYMCPVFMCFTITVNLFACIFDGSKYLGFDRLNWWQAGLISVATGLVAMFLLSCPLKSWLRNRAHRLFDEEQAKIQRKMETGKIKQSKITDMHTPTINMEKIRDLPWYKYLYTAVPEDRLTTKVFNALQIVSSSLLSFSHGANDTANTVGPLLAVWMTYQTGYAFGAAETRDDSQVLLAFGAVAMIVGFLTLGHRTIKLIAKEITVDMSPISGFAIELGTAFTVLVCVKIGVPISSTHCAVGAVLFVGMTKSTTEGVSFKTFKKICIVWLLCFPVAAVISLLVTMFLVQFV
ncbi:phosphate transporter family protein [Ancylostoma caninum]|uniref:Phosphate transporter n=1 Tax=Ancylostoma caninum TaxID=29170 RepID=A0A368GQ63_ANCCA|nr:phosphate transporter family protein [Ancylostoma caninum]